MKRALWVIVVNLLAMPLGAQTHVRFSTTVHWPNSFERAIRPGLVFTMEPLDGEWRFGVKSSAESTENYAECVTGPLHGPTNLDLLPWRWAPNAPKGDAQHVPDVQEFGFVLDDDSQKYECAEAAKVANEIREGRNDIGSADYKARPQGNVRVTVLGFRLQPDGGGFLFREVKIAVDITVPDAKEKRPR